MPIKKPAGTLPAGATGFHPHLIWTADFGDSSFPEFLFSAFYFLLSGVIAPVRISSTLIQIAHAVRGIVSFKWRGRSTVGRRGKLPRLGKDEREQHALNSFAAGYSDAIGRPRP